MRRVFWVVLVAAVVYVLAGAPSANATNEPFTVTTEGVTLTEGTFQANGHVNWRTTTGTGSVHFDPNNGQPGGTYIGATFFPIPLAPGECIVWVQVHPFNYHFGENGEEPVCAPSSPPSSTPPTSPAPTAEPEPSPSVTPPSEPTPAETPAPQPTPSQGIGTPEYPTSTASPAPQGTTPTEPAPTTSPREGLAATGPHEDRFLFATAATILIIAGACALYYLTTRRPRR